METPIQNGRLRGTPRSLVDGFKPLGWLKKIFPIDGNMVNLRRGLKQKWGYPHFWMIWTGKSYSKWMIWGYHYFRKPPYIELLTNRAIKSGGSTTCRMRWCHSGFRSVAYSMEKKTWVPVGIFPLNRSIDFWACSSSTTTCETCESWRISTFCGESLR